MPHAVTPPQSASASPAAAAAFAIIPCIIVMLLPSWPAEAGGLAVPYCLGWTLGKEMQGHHERAPTGSPTSLRGDRPGQVSEGAHMDARCHLHSAVGVAAEDVRPRRQTGLPTGPPGAAAGAGAIPPRWPAELPRAGRAVL